jgi:hypothetical protein
MKGGRAAGSPAHGRRIFEYAFERILNLCEIPAALAPRGHPSHDITIRGVPFSLKTQADQGISHHSLHISKFMELGSGTWTDQEEDFWSALTLTLLV